LLDLERHAIDGSFCSVAFREVFNSNQVLLPPNRIF
jgi:hypothetical protein